MIPSLFPVYELVSGKLLDGLSILATEYCRKSVIKRPECKQHYASLEKSPAGYYQCPFGFTTLSFSIDGEMLAMTGVIAHPRFDNANERLMAKKYPSHKVARDAMDAVLNYIRSVERSRADAIEEASKVLPQAFHELRKLNGAMLQHAEKEIKERGETRGLISIRSAAELMRNNFDILEALSNIEGMRALPIDSSVNVFDLAFKMKRVLQERAEARKIHINVEGVRAIIKGSQKSFPIVPAVLMENAIKYGTAGRPIRVDISTSGSKVIFAIENETSAQIDTERCFERGARFCLRVEGGGFGLYLAKEVVVCHGGTIRCEKADDIVRIIVELPLMTIMPDMLGRR